MLVKPDLSDQRIIECLRKDYGIEIMALTFLPLGADANAAVYKAASQDHSYFLKLKRGHHHDVGLDVVELLQNAGLQQIIFPIKAIDGQASLRVEDFTLIIYPFVEGKSGFECDLSDEQWLTLGEALKQVHDIEVPESIQGELRREMYSSKWRDIVRDFYSHIETGSDEVARKLLAFMKENAPIIHRLVDRAEELAQEIQLQSPEFVLCHSDIHGGNVMLDGDKAIYIVDWDDPIMAPKERDLMFIGGGVANVWNKPQEEKLFYKSYGSKANPTILAYYRHERIVEDIALYCQDLLLTAAGGANRLQMYQHFMAMFEPNGVVDIAFRTS